MAIEKLSARKVATATKGKYEDGGGLRLFVTENGSKRWILRYTLNGRRREMGLGSYPDIQLSEARSTSSEIRRKVRAGLDPIEERKRTIFVVPTFSECAKDFIEAHKSGWKNVKHASQWVNTIATYAEPHIGSLPVDQINVEDILKVLTPIWTSKNETAKRLQTRIAKILDYATARNFRDGDNPARWQGKLDTLLPKPASVKTSEHHPAMPYREIGAFWLELSRKSTISSIALRFLILTATRTSEVLLAKWEEIDLEKKLWVIPAERMKAKKEHRVPLTIQCIKILEALPRFAHSDYLFPGARTGKPLSNMTLLKLMRDMGYGVNGTKGNYVPHGFRSSFRDWSGEVSNHPRDVAEMALAHTIESKVEAAYRRGDLLEKRSHMMQDWADYFAS
ncbi:MAG: integrase arm-type DNA-binding domain-containing protein [Thalassolituus oleivorans]|uniref:tyrosine-type recombinase/integrase n=1 Tax=Thalassolituus oleivorans TaxID=187493 RepID=UPI001B5A999E|nr:site-specific integrase [Thalassolituus oleivorans]MBQ0726676.1 integrase arm-type DNA-binding domain-containing protein [Thalassolituus oleivorans]MBQ0780234.1 integrase arm-type DNA-binding domain-containing protein [Thalassolituus oleivorans]